jgi:hypothetical protein
MPPSHHLDNDTLLALRSLDPADTNIDPHGRRAREDLARITSTLATGDRSRAPGSMPPPRPSRAGSQVRRRLVLGGAVVAAVTVAVVLLPSVTGGDDAFATWSPNPMGLSAEDRDSAVDACRQAQRDGPGTDYAGELSAADPVVAESRGVWTTVLLAGAHGFSAMCITDESTRLFGDWIGSIGTPSGYADPKPRQLVATDLGTGSMDAGELSLAAGEAGSQVAGVTYHSRDHGDVVATVNAGHFALWLPGNELQNASRSGMEVDVTYRDGSTTTSRLQP